MRAGLKIGAVGICQIHGVGLALAHLLPQAEVRVYEAPIVVESDRGGDAADQLNECDIVFTHALFEEYGELATERLRQRVPRVFPVPLVVFTGFHPDMSYMHHDGRKLRSPLTVYHSLITASAFTLGYNEAEAELLFNRYVFAELGYLDQYHASWDLLVRDLTESGFAPHLALAEWRHNAPFMHGINHPKVWVLARIARAAAILTGLVPPHCPVPVLAYDWLACDAGWPVYPEIGSDLGIAGSYLFKQRSVIDSAGLVPMLPLSQFIRQSYEMYRTFPSQAFRAEELAATRQTLLTLPRSPLPRQVHPRSSTGRPAYRQRPLPGIDDARPASGPPIDSKPARRSEALAAVQFIVGHMQRTVELDNGAKLTAIPETADPMGGDDWFWTDDNAKVLEFLSRPDLWAQFPEGTGAILHFVRSMCRSPFIFRRLSTPRLTPAEGNGTIGGYHHSLMNLKYDLRRGGVAMGMRFHDERNVDHVLFFGNEVEFTYHRRRYKVPAEAAIEDVEARQDGHALTLRHSGDLYFTPKRNPVRLGRMAYRYRIDARSMLFEIEASLELAAIGVSDVVLTIGHDQLGQCHYRTIDADTRERRAPLYNAEQSGRSRLGMAGASYYVIRHGQVSGDALALHATPREPARLSEIDAISDKPGRLQRVIARYSFPGLQRGSRIAAAEHKLLTGGGFYDRIANYAALMREVVAENATRGAACDFSISYDYGVVINAFAKCYGCSSSVLRPADAAVLQAELRSLIDAYLRHYLDFTIAGHRAGSNTVFSRELAFVILGVVTMHRATGAAEYRVCLGELCEALLDLESQYLDAGGDPASGFLIKMHGSPPVAHVDCHSAALFALVQAAPLLGDGRLAAAIDRGLGAYCLLTAAVELGSRRRVDGIGTLLIDGTGEQRCEPAFWNFKAGLTLRLFAALRTTADPAVRAVAGRHRDRLELLETILRRQIDRSIVERGNAIEIRTSVYAAETNSETQPWVMLGLRGHPLD